MKYFIKLISAFVLMLAATTALAYFCWYLPKFKRVSTAKTGVVKQLPATPSVHKIKYNIASLQPLVTTGDYNDLHCFLVDMSIASGKNRFFIYNLQKDSVERAGLVTHGSGSDKAGTASFFSNKEGSNCTSLGRYRVGGSYNGRFGLAFKLHGLDKTNNNAFNRSVVLHSHGCVPNEEVAPFPICLSLGCPTVAPDFLLLLKKYINESEKPVLLMIYK